MNPTCFCGAKGEVPCVCTTQLEQGWNPDEEVDYSVAYDNRTEWTHPEDFGPPEWTGVS